MAEKDIDKDLEEAEEIIKDIFEDSIGEIMGPLARNKFRQMRGEVTYWAKSIQEKEKEKRTEACQSEGFD